MRNSYILEKVKGTLFMNYSDETIHQLTESLRKSDETIRQLAETLARSEKRYQSLEKIFRWGGVAVICLTLTVFYVGFDFVTQVRAQQAPSQPSQVQQQQAMEKMLGDPKMMEQLFEFIGNFNNLIKNMNNLTTYLSLPQWDESGEKPEKLTTVVEKILKSRPRQEPEKELKEVQAAGGGAITYMLTEAMVGLGRLDNVEMVMMEFLDTMKGMNQNMRKMNRNMEYMSDTMYIMSNNMGIMSYDMDSTLGRAGRAMPWMPW